MDNTLLNPDGVVALIESYKSKILLNALIITENITINELSLLQKHWT